MTKICLEILRRASALICNRNIALAFHEGRAAWNTDERRLVAVPAKRIGCCLASTGTQARLCQSEGRGKR
jgi:hypothetical protein